MKKLFAILAAAALLTAVKPASAKADGVALGRYCLANAAGSGWTQGECAKLLATLGPVACKNDSDSNGIPDWQDTGFRNRGECVVYVQKLIRDLLRAES